MDSLVKRQTLLNRASMVLLATMLLSLHGINGSCQADNVTCVTEFYPFGLLENDNFLANVDDATSEPIVLSQMFNFYDQDISVVYVGSNGIISLNTRYNPYTPSLLPISGFSFIAPYWEDVDLTGHGIGRIYYRQTTNSTLLARAACEIQAAFSISQTVSNLFIATWVNVGYYPQMIDRINTFQCVLATTSEAMSFVMFLYADGELQWANNALAGINAGDGINSITIPGSLTPNILNVSLTSNVNISGIWMFQVNEGQPSLNIILQPNQTIVGQRQDVICSISVSLNPDTVELGWLDEEIIVTNDSRVIVAELPNISILNSSVTVIGTVIRFDPLLEIDEGNYSCYFSVANETETATSIQLVPRISRVINLTVTPAERSVLLMGNPPPVSHGNVIIYIVSYNVNGSTNIMTMNFTADDQQHLMNTLGSLLPFTNYVFSVRACTTVRCSNSSDNVTAMTLEDAPSMPINLLVEAINATSVNLTWDEPSTSNGMVRNYTITILDDVMNVVQNQTVSNSVMMSVITQLTPNTYYVVNVSAVTVRSGDTASVTFTTPASPLNVTVNTGNMLRTLIVQWEPPNNPGDIITAYMVTYNNISMNISSNDTITTITGLSPYTNYSITVLACTSNDCGNYKDFTIGTTAEEAPNPPLNVNATTINSTTIQISWDQPGITNGIIRYYIVVYRLNDSSQTTKQNSTDEMIVVTDLDPFNKYVFYVLAFTVESSDPSDSVTAMTAQAAPSAPINVTAHNASSTSILVIWEPPMARNGIILSYRVEYTRMTDNVSDNATNPNTSVIIGMLEKFTSYQVQVFGMTVAEGSGSVIVEVTTDEDTPGIPGDFFVNGMNSTAIIVSWVKPTVINGIITMYRVSYSLGNHSAFDDNTIMVPVTATANTSYEITVSELDPFTMYTVAVRAFTRIGPGNFTETFSILTDPSSSSPPQNFSVVVLNSTTIELLWKYPESPNGEIQGYLILYAEFPNNEEVLFNITVDIFDDASDQTFVVSNLTPFTIYSFRIRAFSFGDQNGFVHIGIATEEIIGRTAEDVPEGPVNFTATAIASTMVKLSWSPPNIINGILLYYTVEIYNDTDTLTVVYSNVTFDDIITGLNENTLYSFVIHANTSAGNGDNATDVAVTFEDRPSAPPQNVVTTVVNSTAIQIFWNPPPFLDQNGDIISYQLMITNQNRTNSPAIVYNITNITSYTAIMLEEYEVYNIKIAAQTSVGLGSFSNPVSNQTFEDVPSMEPQNVSIFAVVSQSFILSWDPPLIGEQNGILISYHVIVIETQIHYTDDGEEIRGMERYLNRTYNVLEGRVQLIDMLHPDYNYTVSIAAATKPGIGPFSDPVTVRTDMSVAPYETAVVGESLYNQGDRLLLNCTSEGGPQLEYNWLFLDDVISNSSIIIIDDINTSHIGNYTCTVSNDAGTDNDTITIYVAPYNVEITGIRRYPYGSDIMLNCTSEGGPLLEYKWMFSDTTIDNDTMLIIASAIVSNGGDYICSVMNIAGFDSIAITIYIGPRFIIDPAVNQEILIDEEFNLTCVSEGFPRPSITWFFNNTMIINGVSDLNISTNALSSTLTKSNANINDSGVYYCLAVSSEFSGFNVTSEDAIITVVEHPVVTPLEHNVTLGTTVTFECNKFGSPPFSYQWFMRNTVTGDDVLLVGEINKFYNIRSTVHSDTGGYFCQASNAFGVLSNSTPAYLLVRPSILDSNPVMQEVYPGVMVSFSCRAEGFSELSYSWFMVISGASIGIEIANENDTAYIITDPMYHDNATGYYCVANNSEGIAISTTSTLIVLRPNITGITITPSQSDNNLLLHEFNDTISLICTAEGGPRIMTSWQFDDGSSVVTVADGNNSVTYVVSSLSTDHTGVYYCEAIIDGMTNTSRNFTLFVAPYNDTITEIVNDSIVNYVCNANGGPGNVYEWLRLRDSVVVSSIQELTLDNTDPLDGGDYQCAITNTAGFTSAIVILNVAAVIVTSPQTQNVTDGLSFMLICNATGYPAPRVEWTLNGTPYVARNSSITLIEGLRSNTSIITVENAMATDTGTYECVTTNVVNSDAQDANVTVQDCPNQPRDVQVSDVNSRNLTINWTEPHSNNDPIISYSVSFQNPDCLVNANVSTQNVTIISMEEQVIITNLHPGEAYTFTIIAINNICHSQSSLPASVHTIEEVPGAPPVVSAIPNERSINVSWMNLDCQDSHGNITMYEVHYVSSDFGDHVNQTLSTSGDETSIEIVGLEEFANYTLKVRAYTLVGPGPYSNLMNIMTLPGFPSDSVRNLTAKDILPTSVELIWETVNERYQNGIILYYNIYYQIQDSFDDYIIIPRVTERNYTINGLMEYEIYLFAVTAVNQVGESTKNVSIVIQTNESTPSTPVQNVMISNITNSDDIAVLIAWDSPSDPNGIIRYYRIEFVQAFNPLDDDDSRKKNTPLDDTVINVFVNITSDYSETSFNVTLSDLVAYRVYNYSIFAANSIGESPSTDGIFLTREDTPLAPTNLTVSIPGIPHTSNVLLVDWESPLCDQGILSGYELCYIEYSVGDCDSNGITIIISSPDQLSYTLNNLSINSNYVVEVRGRTGAGLGDLANATGATDEDAPDLVMDVVAQFLPSNTTRGIYNITWTPPVSTNGSFYQILEYSYSSAYSIGPTYSGSSTTAELDQNQNHFLIEAFYYTNYNFTITTINVKYNISNGQTQSSVQSSASVPTSVRDIKVVMSTPASIFISWNHPEYPNSQLLDYIVYYNVKPEMLQPDETISIDGFENETIGIVTNYNLTGLVTLTNYTILITVSGRDVDNAPFVKELLQKTNTSGPVIIQSSGGDVENKSIINDFVFNGTDSKLSLICTSIYQNEIVEWITLNTSGSVEEKQSYNSDSYNNITFLNPTDNFMSMLRCKSKNTLLYKDVTVIQRNPYFDLLTNATIYAPLASSPVISIIVAIDSDGTTSHQDVISESLVLTRPNNEDFMGKFEQDSTNFQLYHYMFPPLQRQNMGRYVISSEISDRHQIMIEVMITTEALNISSSFISVTLLEGNTVRLSCTPSVIETVLLWTHDGRDLHEDENTTFLPINLNHDLILDNTVVDDSGQYTCRAVLNDEVVEQNITVTVVPACASDFSGALFWNKSRRNVLATQRCSTLHPNFRSGVSIARHCNNDGTWSPVNMAACTMFIDSNPVITIHFTVVVSDSNTMDSTTILSNVLNQIQLNVLVSNSFNNTWSYKSDKSLLLSFTISVGLRTMILPTALIDDIKNSLRVNASNIIPSRFELTNEGFMILGFKPNSSCLCNDTSSNLVRTVCNGPSTSPCICSVGSCMCNNPTYVGDGRVCRLDSDNDGFPDDEDVCPDIYSVTVEGKQSATFCINESNMIGSGCPFGPDEVWNITWPATNVSTFARQKCPGGSEAQGIATRQCDQNGDWETPNVSQCRTVERIRLETRAEELNTLVVNMFVNDDRDLTEVFMPQVVEDIADELNEITNTSAPLLPNDVTLTANTLNIIILVTNITINEVDQPLVSNVIEDVVDVLDTLLDERNDMSFEDISTQSSAEEASSQSVSEQLLMNTEQVGVLLASTLNATNNETVRTISNRNIVIEAQIPVKEEVERKASIQFPSVTDTSNVSSVFGTMTPIIEIPSVFVLRELEEGNEVPIINSVARNSRLPTDRGQRIESLILSSQISTDPQRRVFLDGETVQLTFIIGMGNTTRFNPRCAFFRFASNGNESGRFSRDGITQSGTTNSTFVQCTSTHLTSFAVLVDASGESSDSEALSIVSYIGCSISIACLLFTIGALIALRKRIFNQTQHFIHLNLSIALLLGLVAFVSGIETAAEYRESCLGVAILLHYFFMAAFCWMLSEGILMFIMLNFIFYNGLFKRKRFFFAVGWGLPIPIVVVSAALSHEYYGINDRCWISEENGAIWAFVGPMLLIILINVFLLILILYRIYTSKQEKMTAKEASTIECVKALLKGAIIVIPVLGCTWVFGLLAINENTVGFAWIFTIFNSLQGLFITILYVLRNEKFLRIIKCQTKDSKRSKILSTSEKLNARRFTVNSNDDNYTLSEYNKVICNRYVTEEDNDYNQTQVVSPNIFNVRAGVDNYVFDEYDEIQFVGAEQQESTSQSDFTASQYLRHQQSAGIIYPSKVSDEEAKL